MIPGDLLAGTRVFVAGGAGHVGRVLVGALLGGGATVAVSSRAPERLSALRASLAPGSADHLLVIAGDVADESDGPRVRSDALRGMGGIDAVIASMGGFIIAPSVLDATTDALRRALENYVVAHHRVARNMVPALRQHGGSYTFINGFLAFGSIFRGAGLIATATAAQAMLASVLMHELEETSVRANEVVLYTSFGRADDDERNRGGVGKDDVGRYVAWLVSEHGSATRGRTIHLKSLDVVTSALDGAAISR